MVYKLGQIKGAILLTRPYERDKSCSLPVPLVCGQRGRSPVALPQPHSAAAGSKLTLDSRALKDIKDLIFKMQVLSIIAITLSKLENDRCKILFKPTAFHLFRMTKYMDSVCVCVCGSSYIQANYRCVCTCDVCTCDVCVRMMCVRVMCVYI